MTIQENKKLGLFSIILLGINTILGSGIFLLPGQVTSLVGSWSLLVYGFVTIMILSVAWCFAKCSALFNRDGGAYLYAKHAFGDFIGFQIGMMRWAVGIIGWASLVVGFVTILSSVWPEAIQEPIRSILILSLIIFLGILNMLNLKMLKDLNNVITVAKLLPLFFFIAIGICYFERSNFHLIPTPILETESFGGAALIIFYAFGGFEALVAAAGEMKNPEKNLPIAIMTIIVICAFLYFCIQLIAMGTLGPALATSLSPISDVSEMLLGNYGKLAITIAMLVSVGGVNIAAAFIAPKIGVALAEDKMIPSFIAQKNRLGSPYVAILLTLFATSCIALSGDFVQLVAISAVSRFAQHISTCLAVFVFYKHRLSRSQPLSQLLTMCIPVIALVGIFWLMFQIPFYQLAYGLAGLILSIPLYFLWKPALVPVSEDPS